jgi:hypothetical protein
LPPEALKIVNSALTTKTQAEIPYSLVEYTSIFERPIVEALSNSRPALIAAVLEALDSRGFKLEGVEIKEQPEKLIEKGVIFRRTNPAVPARHIAVSFGRTFISAENLDWSEAEDFISGMSAAINAVDRIVHPLIRSQHLVLGMHIQLKTRPRHEVTATLVSTMGQELLEGNLQFAGVILNKEKSSILVDASAAYANGLFVRITREHSAAATWAEISEILKKDEERLFNLLGLEGVL